MLRKTHFSAFHSYGYLRYPKKSSALNRQLDSAGAGGAINFLGRFILGAQPNGQRDGTVGHYFGTGGAGAQANSGFNGGMGALYGGGGGGGAGRRDTNSASSGGKGGDGYVIIVTECHVQ